MMKPNGTEDIAIAILAMGLTVLYLCTLYSLERVSMKKERLKCYLSSTDQKEKYLKWYEKHYEEKADKW